VHRLYLPPRASSTRTEPSRPGEDGSDDWSTGVRRKRVPAPPGDGGTGDRPRPRDSYSSGGRSDTHSPHRSGVRAQLMAECKSPTHGERRAAYPLVCMPGSVSASARTRVVEASTCSNSADCCAGAVHHLAFWVLQRAHHLFLECLSDYFQQHGCCCLPRMRRPPAGAQAPPRCLLLGSMPDASVAPARCPADGVDVPVGERLRCTVPRL
jgi:hypothetical protein